MTDPVVRPLVAVLGHNDDVTDHVGLRILGHGHAYDLLVEATHELAGHGAERIVAGTDVANVPMAARVRQGRLPRETHRIDLV